MSKAFPINCTIHTTHPAKMAKIGLDDHHAPVIFLWCKKCRVEHKCTLVQMLASWRGMIEGNKQDLLKLQGILQGVLTKIQADLEDCEQEQKGESAEQTA